MSITESEEVVAAAPASSQQQQQQQQQQVIHPTSLEGLLQLRQAGLLRHDVAIAEEEQHLCSTWSSAIRFEEEEEAPTTDNTTSTAPSAFRVVTHLDFGGCRLRKGLPEGTLHIFEQHFANRLTSLNLGGTDLPLTETLAVLEIFPKLQSLHVGANGLGNDGAAALADWIATSQFLTTLDLRYNDIGPEGCEVLCTGLCQQKCFLQQPPSTTTKKNSNHKGVTKLYLEGNRLQDAGALAFASHYQLGNNDSPLEELFLGANQIGAEGAASLAHCLTTNKTLSKLYLEGNRIQVEGADAFSNVLTECQGNTGLKHLFCDNNDIGKEGSKRLAAALNSGTAIGDAI